MWTNQVYGHDDKMARTKTHITSQNTEYTKTQQTLRNNYFLCFSDFSVFLFSIFNYLKDLSKKCYITALVWSMKNIGGLNQFSAAPNLTLSQHFLEKKKKKLSIHSFWVASTDATHIFVWIWGSNMAAFPLMVPDFFIL